MQSAVLSYNILSRNGLQKTPDSHSFTKTLSHPDKLVKQDDGFLDILYCCLFNQHCPQWFLPHRHPLEESRRVSGWDFTLGMNNED